jgi:CxxC motif-containing protein
MRSLTCIICPIGCRLSVEERGADGDSPDDLTVMGNRCSRGAVYAREEVRAPKRVVTATCALVPEEYRADGAAGFMGRRFPDLRRIPVKSVIPCPKERIPALLSDIYRLHLRLPVKSGDVLIADWQGTGLDVIAVRTVE